MRITIERLRTWIVLLGILLVVAIAAFLGYARFRIHQVARDLPQKLGLEIQQSTDNFTISKSHEGHTLFTLHASKAIQYKNSGHLTLHEVSIVIFGKDGSRADRISGSHFEYDPSTKTAKALGPVEIELTDPSAAAAAKKQPSGPPPVPIKVATSDLVFNQDSQVASTDQPLTFQKGDASGSARGATFDSGKGTLLLAHDVILHGEIDDDPIVVKADGANFDRNNRQLYFIREQTDYQQQHVSSDQAVVFFNPDGGADHLTAEGNVHFATDDGNDLRASAGSAQLDAKGALKQVKLDGGLLFVSHDEKHSLHIDSNSGTFTFSSNSGGGKKTTPTHLQLVGAVSAVDQQISLLGDAHGSETRESRADKMDVDLATDNTGHVQAQSVLASGGAVVNVHTIRANAPQQITVLKGDQIYATIENGHEISSLRATGDTALEQSTPGGQDQTSSADALLVKFVPGTGGSSKTNKPASPKTGSGLQSLGSQGSQIASAVQEGHATLVQIQPGTAAGAEPGKTTASADRITYDGASHKIQLTGGTPRIVQSGSELTAAVIEFNQGTGDASASGGIKATYTNPNAGPAKAAASGTGSEAMHIIADHAALDHAKNETTFLGAAHADARLWQGNNAVTAPTIVLSRARQLLTATGPAGGVKAALVESGSGRKAKSASPAATGPSVIRTSGSMLVYSGGERKVTLSGGVTAQNATGTIKASVVELFLNPNAPVAGEKTKAAAAGNPMGPDGQVDRLIAEDHVQITQGERSGSGTKLVYTADDGHFVLTGTTAAPPRITDPQHGTVSGSSLIFNDRDDSVVVSHGQSPTMTDTRTSNDVRKPAQ